MNKKYLAMIWAGFILTLIVPIAWTLERLADGGFESGVDGWTITNTGLEATMVQTTAPNPVRSGSYAALFNNTSVTIQNGVYTGVRLRDCIDLTSLAPTGEHFSFAGYILRPTENTNFNLFRVRLRYYSTSDCVDAVSLYTVAYNSLPADQWVSFRVTGEQPITANSVGLWLETVKPTAGDSVVYFDDLSFYDSTPTAVSLQSFTAQSDSHLGGEGGAMGRN